MDFSNKKIFCKPGEQQIVTVHLRKGYLLNGFIKVLLGAVDIILLSIFHNNHDNIMDRACPALSIYSYAWIMGVFFIVSAAIDFAVGGAIPRFFALCYRN
jgi:hypothetical protein